VLLAGDVAGVVMLVTMTILRLFGPKPVSYGIRALLLGAMLLANAYTAHIVLPEAEGLRREINGPMASVAATDPRRVRFDFLHGLSTTIVTAMALAGIAVAAWEARE
jgi:IS4 transposase